MGQWLSSPGGYRSFNGAPSTTARSKRIDEMLQQQKRMEQRKIKLLLLGAAEAGKTTLLKQMKYKILINSYRSDHRPLPFTSK